MSDLQTTERPHFISEDIDCRSISKTLGVIFKSDESVLPALRNVNEELTRLVDLGVKSMEKSGRIIYVGAGTSGRIGFMDAVECEPTFGAGPDRIFTIIAGGQEALWKAVEGAEDDTEQARKDLEKFEPSENDLVIGLSASGNTPYAVSAVEYAREKKAKTAFICNSSVHINPDCDLVLVLDTGAEVVTGSTRMKAGTSLKMCLNAFSTAVMVHSGRTFGNQMVDVNICNLKLSERARRIYKNTTGTKPDPSESFPKGLKNQILSSRSGLTPEECAVKLKEQDGFMRKVLVENFSPRKDIKAILFDMDGTLTHYELPRGFSTWAALGWAYGIYEDMERWVKEYRDGKTDYRAIWSKCAEALKGQSTQAACQLLFASADSPPLHRGLRDIAPTIRKSYQTAILTSGISMVSTQIQKELEFDFEFSNQFHVESGRFTGTVDVNVPFTDKEKAFDLFLKDHGLSENEVCYVGDSSNDFSILDRVALPVFYKHDLNEVQAAKKWDVIIDYYQLLDLLNLNRSQA